MCVKILVVSVLFGVVWSSSVNSLYVTYKTRSILPMSGGISPNLAESIGMGIQMAMEYCQNAFKWERWNCPQSSFTRRSKQPPNKETAYTKAITAAGVVHAITRNCSRGEIKGCGCDPALGDSSIDHISNISMNINGSLREDGNGSVGETIQTKRWSWGGCSDYPSYALDETRKLLDGWEKASDAAGYVGRHNNKVGRKLIQDTMIKRCRCHGVSGSCSLQTCWMQMAPFELISIKLKEKYKKAVRLTRESVEKSIVTGNSARDIPEEREIPGTEDSLIFLVQSPDHCVPNEAEDLAGTKGRTCSRSRLDDVSIAERKSCRKLCRECGYKVKKIRKEVRRRCNCNFLWCCEVQCETCVETIEEYFCD